MNDIIFYSSEQQLFLDISKLCLKRQKNTLFSSSRLATDFFQNIFSWSDRTNLALSSAINSSVYVAVVSWFRNRIKVNTKETCLEFFFFSFFGLSDLLLQIHNNVLKC